MTDVEVVFLAGSTQDLFSLTPSNTRRLVSRAEVFYEVCLRAGRLSGFANRLRG